MNQQRAEIERLFLELSELPPQARSHRLEALPVATRRKVSGYLERFESTWVEPRERRRIGEYVLMGRLGEGATGRVFLALQESTRRRVAIKLLDPECLRSSTSRFQIEAEALGRLKHRAIAEIYEAGIADDRRPFLAMEFVDGTDLATHCKGKSRAEILLLFEEVCDAIHHAHLRGVIHRDLKPGNILVDGSGVPRVLDFGLARMEDATTPFHTLQGTPMGTPAYMSPEQIRGRTDEIDHRTDIYSLGAVFYELILGTNPHSLWGDTIENALHASLAHDPFTADRLPRRAPGDLILILKKAMAKRSEDRYSSAGAFRDDLRRFRSNQPISVRRLSLRYVIGKTLRRNPLTFATAALLFLSIAVGLVISLVLLSRVTDEAARATRAREYLEFVISGANLLENGRRNILLVEIIEDALDEIPDYFPDDARTALPLYTLLGETFLSLGDYRNAERCFESAIDHEPYAHDEDAILEARNNLGVVYHAQGRLLEARDIFVPILEKRTEILGERHEHTITVRSNLAVINQALGNYEDTRREFELVARWTEEDLGRDHPHALTAEQNVAISLLYRSRLKEAKLKLTELTDRIATVKNPEHPDTIGCLHALAYLLEQIGDLGQAEELHLRAFDLSRKALGEKHPGHLQSQNFLGHFYCMSKRDLEKGEPYLRRAVEGRTEVLGRDHPDTLTSRMNWASLLQDRGEHEPAEALYLQTIERMSQVLGETHPSTLRASKNLATLYRDMSRGTEAVEILKGIMTAEGKGLGFDHPQTRDTFEGLLKISGDHLPAGDHAKILTWVREALQSDLGPDHELLTLPAFSSRDS